MENQIDFEKTANTDLLAPVDGESARDVARRLAKYIAGCDTFTRKTGIKTLVGINKLLVGMSLEVLSLIRCHGLTILIPTIRALWRTRFTCSSKDGPSNRLWSI